MVEGIAFYALYKSRVQMKLKKNAWYRYPI